jgi:hypothetical protein
MGRYTGEVKVPNPTGGEQLTAQATLTSRPGIPADRMMLWSGTLSFGMLSAEQLSAFLGMRDAFPIHLSNGRTGRVVAAKYSTADGGTLEVEGFGPSPFD